MKDICIKLADGPVSKELIHKAFTDFNLQLCSKGLYYLLATTHDDEQKLYGIDSFYGFTSSSAAKIASTLKELAREGYLTMEELDEDVICYTIRKEE